MILLILISKNISTFIKMKVYLLKVNYIKPAAIYLFLPRVSANFIFMRAIVLFCTSYLLISLNFEFGSQCFF